jgi:hypothetical protein
MRTAWLILIFTASLLAQSNDTHIMAQARDSASVSEARSSGGRTSPHRIKHDVVPHSKPPQTYSKKRNRMKPNVSLNHISTASGPRPIEFWSSGSIRSGKQAQTKIMSPPQTTTLKHAPLHSPSLLPSSSASLDNVRHRGANPAVIGGANFSANNAASLNGTRMVRKP